MVPASLTHLRHHHMVIPMETHHVQITNMVLSVMVRNHRLMVMSMVAVAVVAMMKMIKPSVIITWNVSILAMCSVKSAISNNRCCWLTAAADVAIYLHVVADALGSLAVIASSLAIQYKGTLKVTQH